MTKFKLLRAGDLVALLGVSLRKLEQMIARGELPPHIKLGRTRRWRADHIEQWLDSMFARNGQETEKNDGPAEINLKPRGETYDLTIT